MSDAESQDADDCDMNRTYTQDRRQFGGREGDADSLSEERDNDAERASSDEEEDLGEEDDDDDHDDEDDDADSSDNGGEEEDSTDSEGEKSSGDENDDEDDGDEDDGDDGDASGSGHRRRKEQRGGNRSKRSEYEILKLHKRTDKAMLQEDENLQGHKELPNTKPMMELDAGSNVWYQAYVLKESINEAKVRFPDPDGGRRDLLRTWVNKASSRIWRGSYAHGDWQFLGKGAWKPREKPRRGGGGRSTRRGATVNNARKSGGNPRATRSDGGATGHQRKLARGSRRDDEESDADSGQTDGSDEEEAAKEASGATDSDASLAEESHLKRAKQHQKHALARQTVSAPQPANGRTQQLLQLQQQQHRQGIGVQKSGVAGNHAQTDIEDYQHSNRRRQQQQQQRLDPHKAARSALGTDGGGRDAAAIPAQKGTGSGKPAAAAKRRDRGDGSSGWGRDNEEAGEDDDAASAKSARGDLQEVRMEVAAAVEHDLAEGLQRSQGLLDPLAHWFEVHYSLLARSGRLWPNCRNSTGNLESGKLPTGFALDPTNQSIQHVSVLQQQARSILQALPAGAAAAAAGLSAGTTNSAGNNGGQEEGVPAAASVTLPLLLQTSGSGPTLSTAAGARAGGAAAGSKRPGHPLQPPAKKPKNIEQRQQQQPVAKLPGGIAASTQHRRVLMDFSESDDEDGGGGGVVNDGDECQDDVIERGGSADPQATAQVPRVVVSAVVQDSRIHKASQQQRLPGPAAGGSSHQELPAGDAVASAGAGSTGKSTTPQRQQQQQHQQRAKVSAAGNEHQQQQKQQQQQRIPSGVDGSPGGAAGVKLADSKQPAITASGRTGAAAAQQHRHGQSSNAALQPQPAVHRTPMSAAGVSNASAGAGAGAGAGGGSSGGTTKALGSNITAKPSGIRTSTAGFGVTGMQKSGVRAANVNSSSRSGPAVVNPAHGGAAAGASSAKNKDRSSPLLRAAVAGSAAAGGQQLQKGSAMPLAAVAAAGRATEPSVSCNSRSDAPDMASTGDRNKPTTSGPNKKSWSTAAVAARSGINGTAAASHELAAARAGGSVQQEQQQVSISSRRLTPPPSEAVAPAADASRGDKAGCGANPGARHGAAAAGGLIDKPGGSSSGVTAARPPRPSPPVSPMVSPQASPVREGSNEPGTATAAPRAAAGSGQQQQQVSRPSMSHMVSGVPGSSGAAVLEGFSASPNCRKSPLRGSSPIVHAVPASADRSCQRAGRDAARGSSKEGSRQPHKQQQQMVPGGLQRNSASPAPQQQQQQQAGVAGQQQQWRSTPQPYNPKKAALGHGSCS